MRGRKPKPTQLKILAGNPGKRPLPTSEPAPRLGIPEPPAWLDRLALAEWERLAPELEELGLLALVDRDALAAHCDALSEWARAKKELRRGIITTTPQGYKQAHPALSIARKAREHVKAFAALFGLSPADRARLHVEKPRKDEGIEKARRYLSLARR